LTATLDKVNDFSLDEVFSRDRYRRHETDADEVLAKHSSVSKAGDEFLVEVKMKGATAREKGFAIGM